MQEEGTTRSTKRPTQTAIESILDRVSLIHPLVDEANAPEPDAPINMHDLCVRLPYNSCHGCAGLCTLLVARTAVLLGVWSRVTFGV